MGDARTMADFDDAELEEQRCIWIERFAFATSEFSADLSLSMIRLIERMQAKRAEGLDPMRGVEFPFAENH